MRDIVLVPTYNEKENIAALIKDIFTSAPNIFIRVVDDNSPDGTARIVQELTNTYPNLSLMRRAGKEGLGIAYIDAFRAVLAEPDVRSLIMMDADFSHDPKYLPEMLRLIEANDAVIGARYIAGGGTEGWEWHRKMLSRFGNLYCRMITRMPIHDCTGGFNCIRIDMLRKIDLVKLSRFKGYAFMMALKYNLWSANARVSEIPIIFKNRTLGASKISQSIIREGIIAPWRIMMQRTK